MTHHDHSQSGAGRPSVLENISESSLDELELQFNENDRGEWDRVAESLGWSTTEAQAVWDWFSQRPTRQTGSGRPEGF